jgi:hypothetical protein
MDYKKKKKIDCKKNNNNLIIKSSLRKYCVKIFSRELRVREI